MTACKVVVTGDWHTNSTLGLCPPRVPLDEGGEYSSSKAQRWLWRRWIDFWRDVADASDDLPIVAIVNGDIYDGDHHNTPQLISRNDATMHNIALAVAEPMLDVADSVYVIRGTEIHEGKNASMAEHFAHDIGATGPTDDVNSWWHLYADFGGVVFDVAHHPESSSLRPWTAGAGVNRIAAYLAYSYAESNNRPPDVALRAHKHGYRDSGTTFDTRVFVTPPWQLTTAFGYRIGVGSRVQRVGGIILTCIAGEYTLKRVLYQPRRGRPHKWKV